jgi:predicted metal-dependent enzyme (double-stranded beta helix superfamily)
MAAGSARASRRTVAPGSDSGYNARAAIRRQAMAGTGTIFDVDQFIADCRAACEADPTHKAAQEVVERAVADPAAVLRGLGEPQRGEVQTLYRSDTLTILNLIWPPHLTLPPHNHCMWAVIGIYTGREDNIFWRRLPHETGSRVEAAGAKALSTGDVAPLGRDIIHSVTNPIGRLTAALHVYGGDFFADGRSEWDPETLIEEPFDVERSLRRFEAANAALQAA